MLVVLLAVAGGCRSEEHHPPRDPSSPSDSSSDGLGATRPSCPDESQVFEGAVGEDNEGLICSLDAPLESRCELDSGGTCLGFLPYVDRIGWLGGHLSAASVLRCLAFDGLPYDVVTVCPGMCDDFSYSETAIFDPTTGEWQAITNNAPLRDGAGYCCSETWVHQLVTGRVVDLDCEGTGRLYSPGDFTGADTGSVP